MAFAAVEPLMDAHRPHEQHKFCAGCPVAEHFTFVLGKLFFFPFFSSHLVAMDNLVKFLVTLVGVTPSWQQAVCDKDELAVHG